MVAARCHARGPALVASAVVAAGVWLLVRPTAGRVTRTTMSASGTAALTVVGGDRDLAITPDGSRIVYVGNQSRQLFVRALDSLEPVAVFTGAPRGLFVSPDGQWIGFVDNVTTLKKVAVTGGPAVTLATLDGSGPRGATWGTDDSVIVATNSGATGLQRVDLASGRTTILTRPDRSKGEADHLWPELLPGGRAVLFTIAAVTGGPDAAKVAVLDLQSGAHTILVPGASHAHYVPSGHLMYAAGGTLWAVAFDLARLETRGTPVLAVRDVVTTATGGVDAVVAGDGTLAYISGRGGAGSSRALVWVDRQGRETPISRAAAGVSQPRLSPDGTRVAVAAQDQEIDIWVWDLGRTTLTRVTFDPDFDHYPVWTRDSLRVIFSSQRGGARNLFWQAADGTGTVERLTDSPNQQNAVSVSPDGRRLIFTETSPKTGEDVMQLELDGSHRVTPLVQSQSIERNGMVSPDGRWLAYESNESGRFEISVRPFPDVNRGHWQVSTAGGTAAAVGARRAGAPLCLADWRADAGWRRTRPDMGGDAGDAGGQGRLRHDAGEPLRSFVRYRSRWPAVPRDQGERRRDRRATEPRRGPALARGAETARADTLTEITERTVSPQRNGATEVKREVRRVRRVASRRPSNPHNSVRLCCSVALW